MKDVELIKIRLGYIAMILHIVVLIAMVIDELKG